MTVGDEIGVTEETYQKLIGSQAVTIDILMKRVAAKDQHIAQLEARVQTLVERSTATGPGEEK